MNKSFGAVLAVVLAVAVAAPVLAVPASAATTADTTRRVGRTHHLKGEVVAVNQDASTVTVRKSGRRAREYTFTAADRSLLSDVRTGERVKVSYVKHKGQRTLERIEPQSVAAK